VRSHPSEQWISTLQPPPAPLPTKELAADADALAAVTAGSACPTPRGRTRCTEVLDVVTMGSPFVSIVPAMKRAALIAVVMIVCRRSSQPVLETAHRKALGVEAADRTHVFSE
jgi:hypothetical protein